MKAILAFFMAILTAILSLFGLGGVIGGGIGDGSLPTQVPGITNGEWLKLVTETFNLADQDYTEAPYFGTITAADPYFPYVQISCDWGIVLTTDSFKTGDKLQNSFMAVTLVRAAKLGLTEGTSLAGLGDLANAEEIAAAIANGLIALQNGKFKEATVSLEDATAAAKEAFDLLMNKKHKATSLDVTLKEATADLSAQGLFDDEIPTTDTELKATDVFEEVAFEGDFAPDLRASAITDAKGAVLNDGVAGDPNSASVQAIQGLGDFSLADLKNFDLKALLAKVDWKSLLKKINFSFDIPLGSQQVSVNMAVVDDGFRASLSGFLFDGISLSKSYELTNFVLSTDMDANLLAGNIRNTYVRLGYDMVEKTAISGGYAGSLSDIEPGEGEAPADVMERLKAGLIDMVKGTGGTVNLFTAVVPIPNLPAMTVTITFSLTITVDGQISITVTSNELKGFEIVNGRAHFLNQSTVTSENYYINANAEAKANVSVDLSLLGFCLVDVGVSAGIGATAYVDLQWANANGIATYKIDNLPAGLVIDTKIPSSYDGMTYTGEVYVYWILEIYYGRKSKILSLIPSQYREFKILGKSGSIAGDSASLIYHGTFNQDGAENRVFGKVV
ncbi:MAG: hypothetical protein LBC83_05300 [Oscillospiraceae bacterium]|nr:hypothetical protein [Oscillospiraceae bacterium]